MSLSVLGLGNDIVDLLDAAELSLLSKPRFLERVFSLEERIAILNSCNAHKLAWAVWAAKEAAFKSHRKMQKSVIFKHRHYSVAPESLRSLENFISQNEMTVHGQLCMQSDVFLLRWQSHHDYIHCTSTIMNDIKLPSNGRIIQIHIQALNNGHSSKVATNFFSEREYESILSEESLYSRYFAKRYLWSLGFNKAIEIIRLRCITSNRLLPPCLMINNRILANEISLSHDGAWTAVAVTI